MAPHDNARAVGALRTGDRHPADHHHQGQARTVRRPAPHGLGLALAAGLPVEEIVGTAIKTGDSLLETGFGNILGHIAVIIGLGTVLGAILERSGGADVLTRKLLGVFGEPGAPIAMGLLGLIFGIPVFFDIGIFVLAPLVYVAAKRGGKSLVLYAMPMVAGLSMTHAFCLRTPGRWPSAACSR